MFAIAFCNIVRYYLHMRFVPGSLKHKVVLGYVFGLALMLGVAFVNWRYLHTLEKVVESGEKVSGLFETTLEIRRFEKNYFLYGVQEDYDSLKGFVDDAEAMLARSGGEFRLFADEAAIEGLRSDVLMYKSLLKAAPRTPGIPLDPSWENKIREKGKAIVTEAEGLSKSERRIMQASLQSAGSRLLVSVAFLTSIWFLGGFVFYRMFIRPLGLLEGHMRKVAGGEMSFIPIKSRDREIVSLNSAFNRMLNEIEWRQSHLVQSEKLASLGTLLFGVAHELNNPLSNISTSCEILKEEIADPDMEYKKELLAQVESETDRAKEIVRSLLDYSRAGKKEPINLKQTVEESIHFIRGEAPARVEIKVRVPGGITLFADKQRLQQVFLNLLKNGIDAMPDGGVINVSARPAKGGAIEIKVSDSGKGMDPEILPNIFDPFFTTKEVKKGYGLGLFIVHHIIVDEHKGSIDVESSPGHGTAFLITLPMKEQ